MKVYIVEMYCYDGYTRYGVYSSEELAKEKLKEIFEEKSSIYNSDIENDFCKYKVEYTSETEFHLFVKCGHNEYNSHEDYYITEVEVEDGINQ